MGLFSKRSREAQAVLGLLDEAKQKLEKATPPSTVFPSRYSEAFELVRSKILANPEGWEPLIQNERDRPRVCLYIMISTVARAHVQNGQYHIYRGMLSLLGLGNDLLRIFDGSIDKLLKMGAVEADVAEQMKDIVRTNIKGAG